MRVADAWDRYQKANVAIFGVSADDQQSHQSFAKEQKLPFPILADPAHAWSSAFGVPTRLGMASRVTFLRRERQDRESVSRDVDPPGVHAEQVLEGRERARRVAFQGPRPEARTRHRQTLVESPSMMSSSGYQHVNGLLVLRSSLP